jgi:hypothetical protein
MHGHLDLKRVILIPGIESLMQYSKHTFLTPFLAHCLPQKLILDSYLSMVVLLKIVMLSIHNVLSESAEVTKSLVFIMGGMKVIVKNPSC